MAILYSVIGTWLTHKITRKLIPLTFQQEKCEADFRFHLMRVKEYAESISFLRGEKAELSSSKRLFGKIWQNWQYLTGMKMKYQAFNSGYNEVARIFPYLVASPRLMSGSLQLGDMMQTATGFYRYRKHSAGLSILMSQWQTGGQSPALGDIQFAAGFYYRHRHNPSV